jgi:hypothetical protein
VRSSSSRSPTFTNDQCDGGILIETSPVLGGSAVVDPEGGIAAFIQMTEASAPQRLLRWSPLSAGVAFLLERLLEKPDRLRPHPMERR